MTDMRNIINLIAANNPRLSENALDLTTDFDGGDNHSFDNEFDAEPEMTATFGLPPAPGMGAPTPIAMPDQSDDMDMEVPDSIPMGHDDDAMAGEGGSLDGLSAALDQSFADKNVGNMNIDWHTVGSLPGYLQTSIKAMSRLIFEPFTDTPTEEIQVVSVLAGNSEEETDNMYNWIKLNGDKATDVTSAIGDILPNYSADVSVYDLLGYQFMLVRESNINSIYAYQGNGVGAEVIDFPANDDFSNDVDDFDDVSSDIGDDLPATGDEPPGMDLNDEMPMMGESKKTCWDGYKKVGTKKKNGKTVNNCVKK